MSTAFNQIPLLRFELIRGVRTTVPRTAINANGTVNRIALSNCVCAPNATISAITSRATEDIMYRRFSQFSGDDQYHANPLTPPRISTEIPTEAELNMTSLGDLSGSDIPTVMIAAMAPAASPT